MKTYVRFILLFAYANLAFSQHNTTGKLSPVTQGGLHEIRLPNEIRSFSNRDLSDFRILDKDGNEAPYFIREKPALLKNSEYVAFKTVSKNRIKDSISTIIFQNPFKVIQDVVLSVANYSGAKRFSITGSNDLKAWFGVLNYGRLSNIQGLNDVSVDKTITFPRCSYKYLKITFNDVKSFQINVLKIGGYENTTTSLEMQEVPYLALKTLELKQEKKTLIEINFKNKELINQIEFKVSEPEFFNRNVTLFKKETRVVKNKEEVYNKQLAKIKLNSETETVFNLPEIFEDTIYIEIENKDSNNLTISKIKCFQKPVYIITSLKANQDYTIKTGAKKMKSPEYDLSFFRNRIPENLPQLKILNLVKQEEKPAVKEKQSFWQKPWFMWLCIVITGLIIIYFSSSLVKDLKKE